MAEMAEKNLLAVAVQHPLAMPPVTRPRLGDQAACSIGSAISKMRGACAYMDAWRHE